MKFRQLAALIATLSFTCLSTPAYPTLVDFEGLPDLTAVDSTYATLSFVNATILTAGVSLNEFEFPPRSGSAVAFDDGGSIVIDFDGTIDSIKGFVTYLQPLTITAFDAFLTPVLVAQTQFASNLALSGDPGSSPNEAFELSWSGGIARLSILGDPLGSSFVLDDLAFDARQTIPEPSTVFLVLFALAAGVRRSDVRGPMHSQRRLDRRHFG